MLPARAGSLLAYLAEVPDPRGRKGRRHPLTATPVAGQTICDELRTPGIRFRVEEV